ncbi:hypothetical protein NL676_011053 [Syzygium grande]|nr:hypothetical protein NL676_011053 [Syzygium grande]
MEIRDADSSLSIDELKTGTFMARVNVLDRTCSPRLKTRSHGGKPSSTLPEVDSFIAKPGGDTVDMNRKHAKPETCADTQDFASMVDV